MGLAGGRIVYRRNEKHTDAFEKPDVDITLRNTKCR